MTTDSSEEGLRLARELRPDVITLDVMMPRTDGWAVLSALKEDPAISGIPVVMLSVVDERNLGYLLGASEYLTKPIDRARLATFLDKYRPGFAALRVLLVEDDADTRRMLSDTLREFGCQVEERENGQQALAHLAAKRPDLIVLDVALHNHSLK